MNLWNWLNLHHTNWGNIRENGASEETISSKLELCIFAWEELDSFGIKTLTATWHRVTHSHMTQYLHWIVYTVICTFLSTSSHAENSRLVHEVCQDLHCDVVTKDRSHQAFHLCRAVLETCCARGMPCVMPCWSCKLCLAKLLAVLHTIIYNHLSSLVINHWHHCHGFAPKYFGMVPTFVYM